MDSPEKLAETLKSYKEALQQEYETKETPRERTEYVRTKIVQLVPDALESISYLLRHAESESVRANLSKYVLDNAQKAEDDGKEDNPLKQLLQELTRNVDMNTPVDESIEAESHFDLDDAPTTSTKPPTSIKDLG